MNVNYDVERLKRIPISDVVSQFDSLRRRGSQLVTLCPLHDDHSPSLYLVEKTNQNYCHCFACDRGGSTIDYVMWKNGWSFKEACEWLSSHYGIPLVNGGYVSAPNLLVQPRPVTKVEKNFTYVPMTVVSPMVSLDNSLSQCLKQTFGLTIAQRVTDEYMLGALGHGECPDDTVFWSIDELGRVHNGKVQRYCTDLKQPRFAHCVGMFGRDQRSYWLSNWLRRQSEIPDDAEFDMKCLFGSHLLKLRPEAKVMLVESPKNAILGSAAWEQYLWVASGSKDAFRPELLHCLQGRNVLVYPDRDAIDDWKRRVSQWKRESKLAEIGIASMFVSDFCDRCAPADQPKYDIGDYVIDHLIDILLRL